MFVTLWCFYREAKALYSCQAEHSHELSFPEGAHFSNGNHTVSVLFLRIMIEQYCICFVVKQKHERLYRMLCTQFCCIWLFMSMQCIPQWNLAGSKRHMMAKPDSSRRIMWHSSNDARTGKNKVHGIHGIHFCKTKKGSFICLTVCK